MSVLSEKRISSIFLGDGINKIFPFDFKVLDQNHILVIKKDTKENISTISNSSYTVFLNKDQDLSSGGHIELVTALATNEQAYITTDVKALQKTTILNHSGFYPQVITNSLDKLTIIIQQILERISRAVIIPRFTQITAEKLINEVIEIYANLNTIKSLNDLKDKIISLEAIKSTLSNIESIKQNIVDVDTNKDNINKLVSSIQTIKDILAIETNIKNLDSIKQNIVDVDSNKANISNVASNKTNIDLIANDISEINTLASIKQCLTDLCKLQKEIKELDNIKDDITSVSDIENQIKDIATNFQDIKDFYNKDIDLKSIKSILESYKSLFNKVIKKFIDVRDISFSKEEFKTTKTARYDSSFYKKNDKFFVIGLKDQYLYEYNMTESEDISTITYKQKFDFFSEDQIMRSFVFDNDGKVLFMLGAQTNTVYRYNLSVAYDISKIKYDKDIINLEDYHIENPTCIHIFKDNLYILSDNKIYQFDATTYKYSNYFFDLSNQGNDFTSFVVLVDSLLALDREKETVYQYKLDNENISNTTFEKRKHHFSNKKNIVDINIDDSNLYLLDSSDDVVYQYSF